MNDSMIHLSLKPPLVETPEIRAWLDRREKQIEERVTDQMVELLCFGSVLIGVEENDI